LALLDGHLETLFTQVLQTHHGSRRFRLFARAAGGLAAILENAEAVFK
jgi:hypothetical protein